MKKERRKKYKLVKLEKEKIIFVKFAPNRSAPKWTSNKIGNATKATTKRIALKGSRHKVPNLTLVVSSTMWESSIIEAERLFR